MNLRHTLLLLSILMLSVTVFALEADFTVKVPDGWTKKPESAALAHYQKSAGSMIITRDYMPSEANTPDAYIEFVKVQLGKTFKNVKYDQVIPGKMDGYETREVIYSAEISGMKFKYDVLYIFNNGKAYTLTGGNLSDLFNDAFKADLKIFFTSFKFK